MKAKDAKGLMEAYASVYKNISESHFKVGNDVKSKSSGMEGKVVKVDPEGKGKYYTVKHEDGKTSNYAPDELKKENGGASKEDEGKFHDKLDKMVHKTFGKRKEEKAMKEHKVNEARAMSHTGGTPHPLQGDGSRPRGMGGKNFGIEDLPPPAKTKTGKGVKEETELFDYLLEYLVAEGYADTNQAALAIMANMSEEWRQSIVDEGYQDPRFGKKQYINKLSKRGGMGMGTPEDPHGYRDPKMAKVGAELSKRKTAAAKAKKTGGSDEYRAEKEAQSKKR